MAIQLITGSSGSGKSHYLFSHLIEESIAHPDRNYFVIVPEQFTMSTQKKLVELHPDHAILNIDILSFNRLAYRVFEELGENTKQILDDTGKNLVLRKIFAEKEDLLFVLKNKSRRPGYIDQVKSFLSELGQYHISPEEMKKMGEIGGMPPLFKKKAADLGLIYESFLQAIQSDYITAEQVLSLLADVIDRSEKVRSSVMVFDGFTGFTPLQNEVLLRLMPITEKMIFTVTIDEKEKLTGEISETELFGMSKKMIKKLMDMARESRTEIEEPIRLSFTENSRFVHAKNIAFLEAHLFRNDGAKAEGSDMEEISVYRLDDPREELFFCANRIRKLTAEEGYRYRDMAIVCGDLNTYQNYLDEVFFHYDIPVFTDASSQVSYQPAVEFIFGFLDVLETDFSYESMMHLLKTSLLDFSPEEVDLFGAYLYRTGIKGKKKYEHLFTIRPAEFDEDELLLINSIRKRLNDDLSLGVEVFSSDTTVCQKTETLTEVLEHFCIEEKCQKKSEELYLEQEDVLAQEYAQIYGLIQQLLEKTCVFLGDEIISSADYAEVLKSGFSAAKIGVIPPNADGVVVGDIERTRLENIKVLFFVGVMDGAIPKTDNDGGVLSQNERNLLSLAEIELAPTQRERSFMQRFYLYQILTKASHRLYITYPQLDKDGAAVKRSYLISVLQNMYSGLKITHFEKQNYPYAWISTEDECRDTLTILLRHLLDRGSLNEESMKVLHTLLSYFGGHREKELKKILDAVFFEHHTDRISQAVMSALNHGDIRISVSRLEQYAVCAYRYFLQYGLKLSEKRDNAFAAYDIGNLYHEALERFSKKIADSPYSWQTIPDELTGRMMDEAIAETFEEMKRTDVLDSFRDSFVLKMMQNTLHRTVWAVMKQVRAGSFEPSGFEVTLAEISSSEALSYELSDQTRLNLSGTIDRMDTYETDDRIYVKIIDYKSGNRDIDLLSMFYGLQIQLVFYMGVAVEGLSQSGGKEVIPAAMMYYHVDDPVIDFDGENESEIESKLLQKLKPHGKIFNSPEVIEAIDASFAGGEVSSSEVVDMKRKKDGSLYKSSTVVSGEDFATMLSFVKKKVRALGEEMSRGQIDVSPYLLGGQKGCTYCPYHGVCGFDPSLMGYDYRRLKSISQEEILNLMKESADA